jgi:hypothetical protein
MRLARCLALLTILGPALAACSGSSPGTPAPSAPASSGPASSPIPSASPPASAAAVWLPEWADASVPAAVAIRRPLPFCGVEDAPPARPGEFIAPVIRACFWAAKLDGREAEFASVQPTMEGARVATIYRLLADGSVEILHDATQDPFGGGAWTLTKCAKLVEEPEGNRLFGPSDCAEAVPLE